MSGSVTACILIFLLLIVYLDTFHVLGNIKVSYYEENLSQVLILNTKDQQNISPLLSEFGPIPRFRREQAEYEDINPSQTLKEGWMKHEREMRLAHVNKKQKVVIYFDPSFSPDTPHKGYAEWIYNFTADAWAYMKKTYGPFGEDPYLYLYVHQGDGGTYQTPYREYSVNPVSKVEGVKLNLLDVSSLSRDGWVSNKTRNEDMDLLLNNLAYFVEFSSKGLFGSPSEVIWKNLSRSGVATAWVDIFTYDIFTNLNMSEHAERYENQVTNTKLDKHPEKLQLWFQNWLLPIYENYGGNAVLDKYFELLSTNMSSFSGRYIRNLTKGEFIHFWSAAAKTDLTPLARKALGWLETITVQIKRAREHFPDLLRLYTVEVTTGTTSTESATSYEEPTQYSDQRNTKTSSTEAEYGSKSVTSKKYESTATDSSFVIIIGAALAVIFILIFVLILSFIFYKRKIQTLETEIRALTNEEVNDFVNGDLSLSEDEAQAMILSLPFITIFEIQREHIIIDPPKILGSGQFGNVLHGFLRNNETDKMVPAAIKTVKRNIDVLCFKSFLSEVKIMAYLGNHENIVQLLGTCTSNIKNREIFIALELCPLGNLENFLKKNRPNFKVEETPTQNPLIVERSSSNNIGSKISTFDLLKWSQEISNAMIYLTEKKVIHGDLAARNVLLTETRTAKISDFGLSRQFLNYAHYMKTSKLPVPWRWLAIESLKELKFSTASDVWAFGVTMWEIFSLGEPPYGAWTYDLFFADKLIAGDRLLKPQHASPSIYELMRDCWNIEPAQRPTFQQIYNQLAEYTSKAP